MVTLTADIGKILTALHHVQLAGKANVETGLQIAQVSRKHSNKRIDGFITTISLLACAEASAE